jgi:formylglycine-generating enzyme required for sulfatase activity
MLLLLVCASSVWAAKPDKRVISGIKAGHEPAAGTTWAEPKTGVEFAWIPSGCFEMGVHKHEDEEPVHTVCLQGFWMGRYEVSQEQYQQVTGTNPSKSPGAKNSVEQVSWQEVTEFTEKMTALTGKNITLPSEAQWEYACRAGGANEKYCAGNALPARLSSLDVNSKKITSQSEKSLANDWGLFDMSNNVWEWTQDCYNGNYKGAPLDGSAWQQGDCDYRVLRGGSWMYLPTYLRSANRLYGAGSKHYSIVGFRVVSPGRGN